MEIKIYKPDDSREYYKTTITATKDYFHMLTYKTSQTIMSHREAKDPVHMGIYNFFTRLFSSKWSHSVPITWEVTLTIGSCPMVIRKSKTRYYINGQVCSNNTLCHALARLTFKSCFEDDPLKLMQTLYSTLSLPENVKYCLENRVPYHFYDIMSETVDFAPIRVRLNVQQIGPQEMAIEVADGVWGTMSVKDLDKFCNYYLHDKRRGPWVDIAPNILYKKLLGKNPRPSDIDVMLAFLKQNRTRDLVEARAIELVNDLLLQYSDRLKGRWSNEQLSTLYVKGKHYDWKLTNNGYKTDIQMVSTYVWQPSFSVKEFKGQIKEWTSSCNEIDDLYPDQDNLYPPKPINTCIWRGPICIDNMAGGSPLGDQFAGRALALLNDSFTITIVNTIKRYLVANPNENRVELDEMY